MLSFTKDRYDLEHEDMIRYDFSHSAYRQFSLFLILAVIPKLALSDTFTIDSDGTGRVLNLSPGYYEMKAIAGGWNAWDGEVDLPNTGWLCNTYFAYGDIIPEGVPTGGGIGSPLAVSASSAQLVLTVLKALTVSMVLKVLLVYNHLK